MGIFSSGKTDNTTNHARGVPDTKFSSSSMDKSALKRATRTRMIWCIITSLLLLVSVIFLILVEIGNTSKSGALPSIYFIKLNLSQIFPTTLPNATLLNSIAQTLGLHDFYQVGLWNYCEGYNGQGVTGCSHPVAAYWFNPVAIIQSELVAGASVTLPNEISTILNIIEIASKWMFGLFLAGTCLSFVMMFVVLLSVSSRWVAFVAMLLTALSAICVCGGSVIATAMFIIMRNEFQTAITEVNIGASIGTTMFALMWVASAGSLLAFLIQVCLSCCCTSRRDVKRGKAKGVKAYEKALA